MNSFERSPSPSASETPKKTPRPKTWKDLATRVAFGAAVALGAAKATSSAVESPTHTSSSSHSSEQLRRRTSSTATELNYPAHASEHPTQSATENEAVRAAREERERIANGPITDPETLRNTGIIAMQQIIDEEEINRYLDDPEGFSLFLRRRLIELTRTDNEEHYAQLEIAERAAHAQLVEDAREHCAEKGIDTCVRLAYLSDVAAAHDIALENHRPDLAADALRKYARAEMTPEASAGERAEIFAEGVIDSKHPELLGELVHVLSPEERELLREGFEQEAAALERRIDIGERYTSGQEPDDVRPQDLERLRQNRESLARLRQGYRQGFGEELPERSSEEDEEA